MVAFTKFFDLSQPVYDKCPGWPTYEKTTIRYEASFQKDGFVAEQITMNSHTGTHVMRLFILIARVTLTNSVKHLRRGSDIRSA